MSDVGLTFMSVHSGVFEILFPALARRASSVKNFELFKGGRLLHLLEEFGIAFLLALIRLKLPDNFDASFLLLPANC